MLLKKKIFNNKTEVIFRNQWTKYFENLKENK